MGGKRPEVRLVSRLNLAWIFAVTEMRDRYRLRSLGIVWAFIFPILMMLFFVFLFSVIFPQRVTDNGGAYIIQILAGLVAWLPIADVLSRTTQVLEANRSLVKQLAFPLEVLPMAAVLVAALPYLPAIALAIGLATMEGRVGTALAILPLVAASQLLFMLGLALFLSIAGLILRDLREIIGIILLVGLFCLPIFYQPQQLPSAFQLVIYANPASYFVWGWQAALGAGTEYAVTAAIAAPCLALAALGMGSLLFKRGKKLLGDLL